MKTVLLIVFLIGYAVIAKKQPKWALFLIAALPMSYLIRFSFAGLPLTVLESMILILFALWSWGKWRRRELVKLDSRLCLWLWFFFLAGIISVFISPNTLGTLGIFKAYLIEPVLLFMVMSDILDTNDLSTLVSVASLGAVLVGVFGLGQRFFGLSIPVPWDKELRITSIFEYPNAVGLYLAPLLPWWVWKLTTQNKTLNKKTLLVSGYWIFVIIISLISIYFAKTEAAYVALLVVAFLFGIVNKKTRWWAGGIGVSVVLLVALVPAIQSPVVEKLLLRDWSGMVRLKSYGETFNLLANNAVFGVGLAGYQEAIVAYHTNRWMEIFLYPHDWWLTIWSELGLLGLVAFSGLIGWFVRNLWRRRNAWSAALLASLLIILIHGLVDVPYFKNDLAVMFWIMLAASNLKK